MKVMVIGKFLLVALLFCIGASGSDHPSEEEFKLFCRILAETNDMLLEPDYVYDEDKDRNILREMQVLYNATTENMNEFRKTLWVTKDFFEAHPPPTDAGNRKNAHSEIGNLIDKGENIIQDSRKIAEEVNEKIKEAKLSVAKGLYGENVKEVPKIGENWTAAQSDAESIFVDKESAAQSCGNETAAAGKTLFNDFFCVCVGEEDLKAHAPCSAAFLSPESGNNNCCNKECCKSKPCYGDDYCRTENCCAKKDCCKCCGSWTQLRHEKWQNPPLSVAESIEKIMDECDRNKEENLMKNGLPALLKDFEEMIGKGEAKKDGNKIFGHSGRKKGNNGKSNEVTKCDGKKGVGTGNKDSNENLCVDYTKHIKGDKTYDIPWHKKFKEATEKMKEVKKIEERILKNRAALLLLKSQAWIAYSREKDDETSNLDDMNVSNLFDGARLPFSFSSLPYLFLYLFLTS
ncbi:Variant surface glycoprotein [Trypanosoma congolense IL3000]|uniref:Variant surface glycoprotein n=1 Tax=Trypanosoma congolense (strain IL3000) TaxID=1068625 RepID=F9WK81_TRYCI|nr:Variant surface glycoprotein [Trypanosoma congolense IL3000]